MEASDVPTFVRANLPAPPARLLEIGAGDGELARRLSGAGYTVLAIDPEPSGDNVRTCALHELDEAPETFDAAVAVVSLHHVEPLTASLDRLATLLRPGALLVIDEFDVALFDERAAGWWLDQRRGLGRDDERTAGEVVGTYRHHLHPLDLIMDALAPWFEVHQPVRGAYLYRWDLDPGFREPEEAMIAAGAIPAVGARLVAPRRR